jgi:hypothetical protein
MPIFNTIKYSSLSRIICFCSACIKGVKYEFLIVFSLLEFLLLEVLSFCSLNSNPSKNSKNSSSFFSFIKI